MFSEPIRSDWRLAAAAVHALASSAETLDMKRILIAAVVIGTLIGAGCGSTPWSSGDYGAAVGDDSQLGRAFKNRTSDVQVEGEGVVTRMLADDLSGSRHQRFIVSLASGQTVLIVHNIDIATRVDG